MIINCDFDGTVVTHDYPNIGKDIGAAIVLRRLVDEGHKIILFTMRGNNSGLSDAVEWFKQNDIPLYGIQNNPTQHKWTDSPKSYADLMIDDSALGCPISYNPLFHSRPYVNWARVEELLEQSGILKKIE